ncbi:hypothetical protein C8R46DRAFT_463619 [Mycena filopes]|nr:hypothetical protein C8R46DRAFT_463619 [Mycena filopes]
MLSRCRLKPAPLWSPLNARGRRFKTKVAELLPFIVNIGTLPARNIPPETTLKPWQENAIQACETAIKSGRAKLGVHIFGDSNLSMLPTLLDRIEAKPTARANVPQAVVIAADHTQATKIAETLAQLRADWTVEIDQTRIERSSEADVLVTTYTHARQDRVVKGRFMRRFDMTALKAIVLSDADSCKPPDFTALWSRLFDSEPLEPPGADGSCSPTVIATTTADDFNSLRRLGHVDELVYRRTFLDSLVENWVCNPRFLAIPAPLGLRNIHVRSKIEFHQSSLSTAMRRRAIMLSTLQAWRDHAAPSRKSTVVYCVNGPHANALQKMFVEANIDARWLKEPDTTDGEVGSAYHETVAAFSAGDFPVLIVTHGKTIDVSRIDCVVLAAPTVLRTNVGNQLLSAMRASPDTGKEDSLIIQILDANRKKPSHQYDLTDLLQLPPEEIQGQPLDTVLPRAERLGIAALEEELSERERRRIERANAPPKYKPSAAERALKHPKPSPYELVPMQGPEEGPDEALDMANKFFAAKKRHWVCCGDGIYVHDCHRRGHIIIHLRKTAEGTREYEAYWNPVTLVDGVAGNEGPVAQWLALKSPNLEDILANVAKFLDLYIQPMHQEQLITKASDYQLATLKQLYVGETMPNLVRDGVPLSRGKFFKYLTRLDASNALARLRYPYQTDPPAFTSAELERIMKRVQNKEQPPIRISLTQKDLEKRKRASLVRRKR